MQRVSLCAVFVLTVLTMLAVPARAQEQNWPRFRGPHGRGDASFCEVPAEFGLDKNLVWKADLPGAGVSSPVIWGDRIYLTSYEGVDRWDEAQREDRSGMTQSVLCLSTDGEMLWRKSFDASEHNTSSRVVRWHGYSSHTPVTDGQAVYAYFGTTGLVALDMDGNLKWHFKDVGEKTKGWGTGASPVLCGDMLIVPAQIESRQLIALNKNTGEVVWKATDNGGLWEGFRWGYSTPAVAEVDGKTQLILGIMNGVAGYDAETGEQIWEAYYMEKGKGHSYPSGSPIVVDGVAYFSIANSHKGNDTLAIKLSGAEGLVDGENLLWHTQHGAYVGGPVYRDGYLWFNHFGNNSDRRQQGFFCLNAETGEVVYWEKRREMQEFPSLIYASCLLTKDKIIVPSVSDGIWVLAAGPEFQLLAVNKFEGDDTAFSASPVPLGDDKVLLRSDKALYCIGQTD